MRESAERTYGETVVPREYEEELQFHQYIPQADAIICDELRRLARERQRTIRILDLGMGPGRLTARFAETPNSSVIGLDESEPFVRAAGEKPKPVNVEYVCADFLTFEPNGQQFDAVVMQGVWHHVPTKSRRAWIEKMSSLLSDDGVLIIGDEVIPEYEFESERETRVGLFYLHIIGEALKSKNSGLARNESLNFLADTLHNEISRGYFDEKLLEYIQMRAVIINTRLFSLDESRLQGDDAALATLETIETARRMSKQLELSGETEWIDRGDYKVSASVLVNELEDDFALEEKRDSGPVDSIGGMTVLTFRQKRR